MDRITFPLITQKGYFLSLKRGDFNERRAKMGLVFNEQLFSLKILL